MRVIKETVNKLGSIPAQPERPYLQVASWFFSLGIMFSFIYICEIIGF